MNLIGKNIKSTSLLKGSYFEDSIIYITEHNEKGAVGFVVNKLYSRPLNELEEFKNIHWPLYEGGPVDQEHIYLLHKRPDLIQHGKKAVEDYFVGGDMKDVINAIQNNEITLEQLKLFIGYCGWDAGELEDEIEEGSWEIDE